MKLIFTPATPGKSCLCVLLSCMLYYGTLDAQFCSNPANTVYGLTSGGDIYPITVSTAVVSPALTPAYAGNAPNQSNGIGYNTLNGKFYYFKINANATPQEFVSFDPATNLVTVLAPCPTTYTIHTGCVSADGLGFYTLDVNATLYYYDIGANTWTVIANTFYDQLGANINATLINQNSGDIAIDGKGNLWVLTSSGTNYGLYEISAPLPTVAVTSITAKQIVDPNSVTPSASSFAGIAFNSTGQIIMATLNNELYRMENNFTLTFLGSFTVSGVGNDLTSCNYPMSILPVTWTSFSAVSNDNHNVQLRWTISQATDSEGFYVENSQDGTDWTVIGYIKSAGGTNNNDKADYTYTVANPANGSQYYRIRETDMNGQSMYSPTKMVNLHTNISIAVWPNPASNYIVIQNKNMAASNNLKATLLDVAGRIINEATLHSGLNTVTLSALPAGTYIVKVNGANGDVYNQKIVKQ